MRGVTVSNVVFGDAAAATSGADVWRGASGGGGVGLHLKSTRGRGGVTSDVRLENVSVGVVAPGSAVLWVEVGGGGHSSSLWPSGDVFLLKSKYEWPRRGEGGGRPACLPARPPAHLPPRAACLRVDFVEDESCPSGRAAP